MVLYGKAYVTVTKCAGRLQNEKNAPTQTHTRTGDDILSFGNHRLTQQGLVSGPRFLFGREKRTNMKTVSAKKYELLIFIPKQDTL